MGSTVELLFAFVYELHEVDSDTTFGLSIPHTVAQTSWQDKATCCFLGRAQARLCLLISDK